MIPVTDLRAGKAFEVDGVPYLVLKYKHTKIGRGVASIKVKVRNLKNGSVSEKTFMNPQDFSQFNLSGDLLDGKEKFLKEGEKFKVLFWNEKALSLELPISMVFKIKETSPGVKGNSATASSKQALLDNDLSLNVPLFINIGDRVKVDTRTGEYLERVS